MTRRIERDGMILSLNSIQYRGFPRSQARYLSQTRYFERFRILADSNLSPSNTLYTLHSHFYRLSFRYYLICKARQRSWRQRSQACVRAALASIMSANRYDREPAYNNRRHSNAQYRGDRNGRMYEDQYYRSRSRERYRRSRSPRERYSSPHGKP